MAINVNDVYQTVLFILNKEQRGSMTPQEFSSIATQVQLEIFDKYFEDLNSSSAGSAASHILSLISMSSFLCLSTEEISAFFPFVTFFCAFNTQEILIKKINKMLFFIL